MAERASILGKESILSVAESLGPISHDVAEALAPEIEYRLRDVIQEARKFMLAARRETLTTADINYALRLRNIEPLYGFGNTGGTSAQLGEMPRFCRLHSAPDVFYLADREVAISDVLLAPFPLLPRETGIKLHWLAVRGSQPVCADNPPPTARNADGAAQPAAKRAKSAAGAAAGAGAGAGADACAQAQPAGAAGAAAAVLVGPAEHVLSQEESLLFARIVATVRAAAEPPRAPPGAAARAPLGGADALGWGQLSAAANAAGGAGADAAGNGDAEAAAAADEARRAMFGAVLRSVAAEPSTGPLAPFLAQFVAAEVGRSLSKTHALRALLRLADALVQSPQKAVEHYVHQLMPALLTCTVHRRLCSSPLDDHWSVRDAAARIVARICARYGAAYPTLQPRVTQTLLGALRDRSRPLTTHYGAIVGLASLGAHIVHGLLLPELLGSGAGSGGGTGSEMPTHAAGGPAGSAQAAQGGAAGEQRGAPAARDASAERGYLAALEPELKAKSAVRQQEAMRVYTAALAACLTYVHSHRRLFELAASAAIPEAALVGVARRAARAEPAARDVEMTEAAAAPASARPAVPGLSADGADEGARSITERALRELLPQLGVNYARLYDTFGEAVLPCVACEPPPAGAARPVQRAPVPPALAGGNRRAAALAADGGAAPASAPAEPQPKPKAVSRPRARAPARHKAALSLLSIW